MTDQVRLTYIYSSISNLKRRGKSLFYTSILKPEDIAELSANGYQVRVNADDDTTENSPLTWTVTWTNRWAPTRSRKSGGIYQVTRGFTKQALLEESVV